MMNDAAAKTESQMNPAPQSLDDIDRQSFAPRFTPWDDPAQPVDLAPGAVDHPAGPAALNLDGHWRMAEGGKYAERLAGDFADAIPATVPGSIHSALFEAGIIPDPSFGKNQVIAREQSFKTWWLRRDFERPDGMRGETLHFEGVANRCTVWLNGAMLGSHEGMFGGPEFDIVGLLCQSNTLIVRLDPIPADIQDSAGPNPEANDSWKNTVVVNNVYGWHYSNLPSQGIWRSVSVRDKAAVAMPDPFIRTVDARQGTVELSLNFKGKSAGWSGTLLGSVTPENFAGESHAFTRELESSEAELKQNLRLQIADPQVWQPVDLGAPNLYRVTLSFAPDGGGPAARHSFTFGLRTIEMAPLPGGPDPEKYNWTFVINGVPRFIKGANWCTIDALLDFSRERYERFIRLAAMQHVQMLRPWGSGMPETDDFFNLCDRYGILVMQEWPTAWNSHVSQPYAMLEETVRRNTLRLRNRASLAIWGGGNESNAPFGPAIDMMGRLSIELDDTRPFHRAEPWGGNGIHDYTCYWGRAPLDHNLNMTSAFFGEFGLACSPIYESVLRYLPQDEIDDWRDDAENAFAYHTPIFNTYDDVSRLLQYAAYFVGDDPSLEQFTIGSGLSQAVGIRHTLERARCRYPESAGILYYKLTDNYPAASWACIDWYGAPKIGHYFFQDAYTPLHAAVIFDRLNCAGEALSLPIILLDDADALLASDWRVIVRAYDGDLRQIKRAAFAGGGGIRSPRRLGDLNLSAEETDTGPLFVVSEVWRDDALASKSFYFVNYETKPGSLFTLPKTALQLDIAGDMATVKNSGDLPAVAVNVARPGHLDSFEVSDNYFWLDAGESATVRMNAATDLTVSAWNADETSSA